MAFSQWNVTAFYGELVKIVVYLWAMLVLKEAAPNGQVDVRSKGPCWGRNSEFQLDISEHWVNKSLKVHFMFSFIWNIKLVK